MTLLRNDYSGNRILFTGGEKTNHPLLAIIPHWKKTSVMNKCRKELVNPNGAYRERIIKGKKWREWREF